MAAKIAVTMPTFCATTDEDFVTTLPFQCTQYMTRNMPIVRSFVFNDFTHIPQGTAASGWRKFNHTPTFQGTLDISRSSSTQS